MGEIVVESMNGLLAQNGFETREGLEYSLEPTWSWQPALLLLLSIAIILGIVVLYLRERGRARVTLRLALAAIRLSLIGMVLLMVQGWMLHRDRTDLPDIVLLIDDSESMQFEDHYDDEEQRVALAQRVASVSLSGTSRWNLAKALLLAQDGDLLKRLSDKYNLKVYRIGASARAQSGGDVQLSESLRELAASQSASLLGKCVRDVLELQRGRPTAAMIVLTDGITTEGKSIGEAASYARRKSIPLYLVGLGNDEPPRDVRLSDLLVDEIVFVNDIVNFDVKLTGDGYAGQTAILRLRRQGDSKVLAEQSVVVGPDGEPRSARLSYRADEAGDFQFVIDLQTLDGESDPENNQLVQLVSVRDETIRVLFAQAYPSFEYRFLYWLLKRQVLGDGPDAAKSIELTTVLQQADEAFADADENVRRVFPVRRDELFEFDVIIFGDVDPAGLGRLELSNLADFVKVRGGGVIFIAGPKYMPLEYRDTPLAELLPIDLNTASVPTPGSSLRDGYSVQPTRLGLVSPQMQLDEKPVENERIWHELNELYWLLDAPDVKPAARILAVHPTRTGTNGQNLPVISLQFVGAGKVVFHSTDETYRWRYRVGDKYFARYWIQTIRYLSRSKLLGKSHDAELTSDFEEYRRGEPIGLRVRFFDERLAPAQDDGVTVVLEREGSKRRHLKLHRETANRGVFEGTLTNLPDGTYRAWLATPTLQGNPPSLRLSVVAPPGEQAVLEMDSADLKLAAKVSDGKFYHLRDADRLAGDLPRGRQVRIASLPPLSIWGMWLVAIAFGLMFVALIAMEWLITKSVGML